MSVIVLRDDDSAIVFTDNATVNITTNFTHKTPWARQPVYTYHRPYQASHGIIYHDGYQSDECIVRGVCAYTQANMQTLVGLAGTIIKVKTTHPRTGAVLEAETRAYVRNSPMPENEVGEAIVFSLELTRVH